MKILIPILVILTSLNIRAAYSQLPPAEINFHSTHPYGLFSDTVHSVYWPNTDTIPYTLYISCGLKGDTLYIPNGVQYMLIDGQIYRIRRKTTITFEDIRLFDEQIKAETFWEQYKKRLGIINDSATTGEAIKADTTTPTPYPYKYFKPTVRRLKNKK